MKFTSRLALPVVVFSLLAMLVSRADDPNALTPEEQKDGWKLLFNGRDLAGWRQYGRQDLPGEGWKSEGGLLKKLAKVRGGDIVTTAQFDDFELSWEWRIAPGGNNGVKYFVSEARTSAPGHEYQMIDDSGHPDGKLGPRRQTASFYDVLPPVANKPLKPAGEWNLSRIIVRGNHVEHWLNGMRVLAYELGSEQVRVGLAQSKFRDKPGFGDKVRGPIMLTDHQDECWFRALKIRPLQP